MNSMPLVKSFLRSGRCQRPPLLSTVFYHASRIDGGGFEELFVEPARLTRALLDQHLLFQTDAVAVRFDEVVFARGTAFAVDWAAPIPAVQWESSGSEDWPGDDAQAQTAATHLIDVVGRLAKELGRQVPVMAVMPGPGRMGARAGSRDGREKAARLLRGIADSVCQAGASIVMIEEGEESWHEEELNTLLAPIINTIRYYNASSVLAAPSAPTKRQANAILLSEEALKAEKSPPQACGISVPASCFESPSLLEAFKARLQANGLPVFLSVGDNVVLGHSTEHAVSVHKSLGDVTFG